jgi:hypothetical protein
MTYKYSESEKFRANILLSLGYVFSTPLCILVLELIKDHKTIDFWSGLTSAILFAIGFTGIMKSYSIMIKRDNLNNA